MNGDWGRAALPWLFRVSPEVLSVAPLLLTAALPGTAGRQFFLKAWAGLRNRNADMSKLVALGTGVAFAYSAAVTLAPSWFAAHGVPLDVYFDAALLIVGFVDSCCWARCWRGGRSGTVSALRGLLALTPPMAERIASDGTPEQVKLHALAPGDAVLVRPGGRVPLDGVVVEDSSAVD